MLAIYWRTVLSIFLLIILSSFIQSGFNSLGVLNNTNFYPTLFWGFIACFFFTAQLMNQKGLVYFFWGKRLGLDKVFWRNLSVVNIIFFISLALLAAIVYCFSSNEVWGYYKLFGQPLMLLVVPLIYIKTLSFKAKV